ncbi:MAG: hypothetical protein EG823_09415 [Actinobacteria bacterium]|nr:hypothetical protein [Actinomycetota bacterium]
MSISFAPGDVVAVLALVLSLVATITTIRFNSRQKSLIESQELLNQRLLAREESDAQAAKRADLSASLVKTGKNNWRLKVYNRGKAVARDVTIEWPDDDDLLIQSDVASKFPLEMLEPAHGVELLALVHMGSRSKHEITLRWRDEFDDTNEKKVYPTL